ncbi:MAG: hypothetical protein BM556_05170 [Bacteriovorax sp. MedPE-SWde]|nr:MAG: hypothetical protein BM556_05170 [Bacteriovorax sp. MedPE-SWde]
MRILSATQQATQNTSKKASKKARPSNQNSEVANKQVVGKTTGGQTIVKLDGSRRKLSDSDIRAKIAEKNKPKDPNVTAQEAAKKKPFFDTSMKEDIADNVVVKSPIVKKTPGIATPDAKGEAAQKATEARMIATNKKNEAKRAEIDKAKVAKTNPSETTEAVAKEAETPKVVNAQGEAIESDVKKNDPKDPRVQEKLRALLKTNAFSFNQKEKSALANILNKQA